MIRGISHTAFVVENMEKALHFYCDILGFKKFHELNNSKGEPWLIYLKIADRQFLELFYGGTKRIERTSQTIGGNHLCLEVDDINEMANRLENSGVTLDVRPSQGKDFNYQCWAKDPDGNRIEFMKIDPKSPQSKCRH